MSLIFSHPDNHFLIKFLCMRLVCIRKPISPSHNFSVPVSEQNLHNNLFSVLAIAALTISSVSCEIDMDELNDDFSKISEFC